ncbi:hypothetical protein DXG01_013358 [Tephrocybe rancida]|nr:hypothetical protein DXG01_013358 [Tephrocybe rancida]
MSRTTQHRRTLSRGSGSSSSNPPRSPSPPTLTYHHPTLLPIPTPALVESVAGAAHYSGVKLESESPSKHRRSSHDYGENHTQLKPSHKRILEDLKELYGCRPTQDIFERSWHPDAVFEPKLFSGSKTLLMRIMSSTHSPNRLVFALSQEYTYRFLGRKKIIDSIVVVDLDEEEKIIRMVDQWNGKDLPRWHGAYFLRVANAKIVPWLVSTPKHRPSILARPASLRMRGQWPRMFQTTKVVSESPIAQATSPLSPIGVSAAVQAAADSSVVPRPKILEEFSLKHRVGIVSGGHRGLGLEMALALCELGARAIYCLDLPPEPSKEWRSTEDFVRRMDNGSRLEYVSADVRDQKGIWEKVKVIGDKEGRMDICIAAAGILPSVQVESVIYPSEAFRDVIEVNASGALYTAQAAGQQMIRFGNSGSIILIASIAAHGYLPGDDVVPYGASKSAVLQIARGMAGELGPKGIRVNTISPGRSCDPEEVVRIDTVGSDRKTRRTQRGCLVVGKRRVEFLHWERSKLAMLSIKAFSRCPQRTFAPLVAAAQLRRQWSRKFQTTSVTRQEQSRSPLAPIGVNAAIQAAADPKVIPRPKIFEEFSLKDRVGIVSGGNRGLGLEMALALCELGARAIYCFDLPSEPSQEWKSTADFVEKIGTGSRLEYVSADVRDQKGMWDRVKDIGDKEGRMDVCVAAAGVATRGMDCLDWPADAHQEVMDVNVNGVLFTAQAAGQQMLRFGASGSIILIASIAGSATLRGDDVLPYNASKAAVLQIARSMACELGTKGIRVNTISPGFIRTPFGNILWIV